MSDQPILPLDETNSSVARETMPEWLLRLKDTTPARILVDRAGQSYSTRTHLSLKADHAFARDAVHAEIDLIGDLGRELVDRMGIFEVQTEASSKDEYLLRPDKGRRLSREAKSTLSERCARQADLQIVLGDGLSSTAVATQVPRLLPKLWEQAVRAGLRLGQVFLIRYCRVGVMNDIGDLLDPEVVVLLVGERPGMMTAESLSAYFAFRPRPGHTDAHRNLISNIHARGVGLDEAARRIVSLVQQIRERGASGVDVKEEFDRLLLDSAYRSIAETLDP